MFWILLLPKTSGFNPENVTSISSTLQALQSGTTCEAIVSAYLQRIENFNAEIGAIITVNSNAINEARNLDYYFQQRGTLLPLHCVTVIVKDVINVSGLPTTCGVALFQSNIASTDADISVFSRIAPSAL